MWYQYVFPSEDTVFDSNYHNRVHGYMLLCMTLTFFLVVLVLLLAIVQGWAGLYTALAVLGLYTALAVLGLYTALAVLGLYTALAVLGITLQHLP